MPPNGIQMLATSSPLVDDRLFKSSIITGMAKTLDGVEKTMITIKSVRLVDCSSRRLQNVDDTRKGLASLRRLFWSPSSDWEQLADQPEPLMCKGTDGDVALQN